MALKYKNGHPTSLIIKENLNHIVTFSHLLDQLRCLRIVEKRALIHG